MPISDDLVLFRRAPTGLDRRALQQFARTLRDKITKGRAFHCLISDARVLLRLNRQFLGSDYATDVLSFPLNGDELLGELAISSERAAEQARHFGHSRLDEIRILMLHGVLHLVGM